MAVYTTLSEETLEKFLLAFDIGELVSLAGISEGVENSNFLVKTTHSRYILTLFERRVSAQDLPWFMGLMEHLYAHGISCPQPVADRSGKIIHQLENRPAVFTAFLEGQWVKKPGSAECFALGKVMGQLHKAGAGYKPERVNSVGYHTWLTLWQACASKADDIEKGLKEEIEGILGVISRAWPALDDKYLPKGQIHADLFPDNVFFLNGTFSGVIDLYFACTDYLAYDCAIALNAWCFEERFIPANAKALLEGYNTIRPLEENERDAFPVLCLGAAMRFFLTRLYDWFHTPQEATVTRKDPRDYLMRLRFFTQNMNFLQKIN